MSKIFYLFLFLILFLPYFLKVKEVICFADSGNCLPEIVSQLDSLKGRNYFRVKSEINKFLKYNNSVVSYNSYFVFPSKFVLSVVLQKPDLVLKDTKTNFFYLIDKEGEVLAKKEGLSEIPFVESDNYDLKVGYKLSEDVLASMSVFYYLNYLYKINYAKLFVDRLEVKILGGPLLILPVQGKDVGYLVGSTRFLINQLESNYEKFKLDKSYDNITIDLRYKNPVLR